MRFVRILSLVVFVCLLAFTRTEILAQLTPPEPLHESVEVRFVVVSVTAMDGRNRYVSDLKMSEFQIEEDGVPQEIMDFSLYKTAEGIPSNIGFLFDNSWSMQEANKGIRKLDIAKAALKRVAGSTAETDTVLILPTNELAGELPEVLEDRIVTAATEEALQIRPGGTLLLDRLSLLVDRLAERPGRRTIIICSDGVDNGSRTKQEELLERIHDADLTIISIITSEFQKAKGWGDFTRRQSEKGKALLQKLSTDTGGAFLFPTSPLDVTDIPQQLHAWMASQYFLSYRSTNITTPGWRSIKLSTTRKEVKKLLYRKGYFAR